MPTAKIARADFIVGPCAKLVCGNAGKLGSLFGGEEFVSHQLYPLRADIPDHIVSAKRHKLRAPCSPYFRVSFSYDPHLRQMQSAQEYAIQFHIGYLLNRRS